MRKATYERLRRRQGAKPARNEAVRAQYRAGDFVADNIAPTHNITRDRVYKILRAPSFSSEPDARLLSTLQHRLKAWRKKPGNRLTQAEAARILRVSWSAYSAWERGTHLPASPALILDHIMLLEAYNSLFQELSGLKAKIAQERESVIIHSPE
jgi:DNA-binding transcriptional regulator YiaG